MADRQLSWRCGSHHLVIGNLAADQTVRKVTGILTNLRRMFIILVNGIILRQDKAGGGRTAHGGSENICAVPEITCHKYNFSMHFPCQSSCQGIVVEDMSWDERLSSAI